MNLEKGTSHEPPVVRRSLTFITMVNDGIWIPNFIICEFKTFNESSDIDAITLWNLQYFRLWLLFSSEKLSDTTMKLHQTVLFYR
ncbi:hypothetical protein [Enterococcus caccae]|uniref:hypothetical protein n=1 Tax=Enterococcus caccae TaxID=317735 RepID=UPI0011605BAD|nr:hypothetical protein [Enterococcus caccae]